MCLSVVLAYLKNCESDLEQSRNSVFVIVIGALQILTLSLPTKHT